MSTGESIRIGRRQRRVLGFSLLELLITLIIILGLSYYTMRHLSTSNQRTHMSVCQKNLQTIYLALNLYSGDNRGHFPLTNSAESSEQPLSLLVPQSTTVTEIFICPGSKDKRLPEGESFANNKISYAYYMGRSTNDLAEVLVSDRQIDPFPKARGRQVFSLDGEKPANNHHTNGGNLLLISGEVARCWPRANRNLLFPTNVVLLNPRP